MNINKSISAALLLTTILSSGPIAADPPALSGIVTRGEAAVARSWVDFDSGLRIVVGADLDEFCAGVDNFDYVEITDIQLASGRIIGLDKGIVQTTVWDFTDFDCALFTTIDPVASGFARIRTTDNDLLGFEPGDSNTNAFGSMVHGKLEDPYGTRLILNAIQRIVVGDGTFHLTTKIVLN